jgi:hypothetical protein
VGVPDQTKADAGPVGTPTGPDTPNAPPPATPDPSTSPAFSTAACSGGHGGAPGYSGLPDCQGPSEVEPNDGKNDANPIDKRVCGKLTAGDTDTFTFDIDQSGRWIGVTYNALGDAVLDVVAPDGTELPISVRTPQSTCAAAPGTYYLKVSSPTGAPQEYTISLDH